MPQAYDVIILGLGAMGSAAADQLSRRGVRVLGLEQFDIPHTLGSSHGESRMIRMAYYEHPDYVPLLRRAYELWHELEDRADAELLHVTGGLYMGPPGCELVEGSLQAAEMHRLPHEMLDADALRKHFDVFHLPDHHVGLLEPMAGFLEPEKCVAASAELARRQEADLRTQTAVRSWAEEGDGVTVRTDHDTFHADRLLITAGPWTAELLAALPAKLTVTRQTLAWFESAQPRRFRLGGFPVWAVDRPAGGIYYGFPMLNETNGLKLAIHAPGEATSAADVDRSLRVGEHDELSQFLSRHLPDAAGPLKTHKVCLYTNTPDHHFIVDRLPGSQRVTLAAGFSGHGFKFASVMGEILAELVTSGTVPPRAKFLGFERLAR